MMRRVCWLICVLLGCAALTAGDSPFERVTISSSPNPVGSGARAAGMGNAFVAVADDATASSWNPAGLIQLLRPEVSVVGVYASREETRHAGASPEFGGSDTWDSTSLNFASLVVPVGLQDRNLVFAISRQELYSFDRSMSFALEKHAESGLSGPIIRQTIDVEHEQDFSQDGSLSALAFSCAAELTPRLSFGASLNVWNDDIVGDNAWTKHESALADAEIRTETISGNFSNHISTLQTTRDTRTLEEGFNANFGLMWHPLEKWTFGFCGKTPFDATLLRESETTSRDLSGGDPIMTESEMHEEMDFPASLALGAAYRHSDFFSMSADVTRVDWSDFVLKTGGSSLSPITGKDIDDSDIPATYAVRVGAEWLRLVGGTIVPLRCGAFYDPEPASGEVRDAWGLSCGMGVLLGNRASVDIAYTYRWADDTPVSGVDGAELSDTNHQIMFSTIFYF